MVAVLLHSQSQSAKTIWPTYDVINDEMTMKVMMKVNYGVIAVNITASKCLACMKRCWDPELKPNSIEEIVDY